MGTEIASLLRGLVPGLALLYGEDVARGGSFSESRPEAEGPFISKDRGYGVEQTIGRGYRGVSRWELR